MERIEGLHAEGRALTAAIRTSYAMADTPKLAREYETWQATLRRVPGLAVGEFDAAAKADIARVIASWSRLPAEVS